MYIKNTLRLICIAAGILGIMLIGFGVYLLATMFGFNAVTIGTIVSGIALLIVYGLTRCMKLRCLACLLLLLITLFLIITGILTILFTGDLVVSLILVGLGILAFELNVVCLVMKLLSSK